jgi:hypothetical protein
VKDPGEALDAARRSAGAAEASGVEEAPWSLGDPSFSARRLAEWAIIEPEQAEVYSTRRLGWPITILKRLLIRLLQQYLGQISAQQSRFNAQIAAHVLRLEERVQALEDANGAEDSSLADGASRADQDRQ